MEYKEPLDRVENLLHEIAVSLSATRSDMTGFKKMVDGFTPKERSEHLQRELTAHLSLLEKHLDYQLKRISDLELDVHLLKVIER